MIRNSAKLLFVASAFLALSASAYGCSCMRLGQPDLSSYEAVFEGKAVASHFLDVTQSEGNAPEPGPVWVAYFEVNTVWKGPRRTSFAIYGTPDNGNCAFLFEEGKSYLVFAERVPKADRSLFRGARMPLTAVQCSGTSEVTYAGELLAWLSKSRAPWRVAWTSQ